MTDLTTDDRKVIEKLKQIVKGSPAENRFDWEGASKEDDEAIRLPGTEARGDAIILSIAELQKRAGGILQPGLGANALALIDQNLLLLPRLDAEYFKTHTTLDKIAFEAPPAARSAYIYRPLKGPSQEFIEARVSAMVNHEVCHIDNRGPYFASASNSEVTCSDVGNMMLADRGYVERRDKKSIVNRLAPAGALDFWAREVLILTDGKFDALTREILPGHEKFVEAIRARIETLKYEGPLIGIPKAQTDRSIALRQVVLDSPKSNGHIDALVKVMREQLEREYDYFLSTNASIPGGAGQSVDAYVERRIGEFKKYLSGESSSFQLSRYFPIRRE